MIWSIKRVLTIGLGFAIGVLALNALVTSGNIRNLIDSGRWVIRTREVLNALDELGGSIRDAEAAQRGYLLTGRQSDLRRLEGASVEAGARLDELRDLTRDNARQQARLPALERAFRARLQELRQTAALRAGGGSTRRSRPSPTAGTSGRPGTSAPRWPR